MWLPGEMTASRTSARGRPHLKVEGGLLRPRVEKLIVGTRDCTRLVDGVINQGAVVRDHLPESVPVHGVLCFVEADWPLIGGRHAQPPPRGSDELRTITPASGCGWHASAS